MHESDEAPPDQGVPHELDAVDRAHAAELAVLLFLCPGLTTQQLEALAGQPKDPETSGSRDPETSVTHGPPASETDGPTLSESKDPVGVEDVATDDS